MSMTTEPNQSQPAVPMQAAASDVLCRACKHPVSRTIGAKNGFDLHQCQKCGVLWAHAPDAPVIDEIYNSYYDRATFEIPPATANSLTALVDSLEPYRTTNRWLDIGYGEGALLKMAENNRWQCYGTEVSPGAIAYGETRKWTVTRDAMDDPRFPPGGFDVVTMIELIEHVPNPSYFFDFAMQMLRPGGVLYLTTPNIGSINYRILGINWSSVISPPEHLTIWSGRGMRSILQRVGFEKIRIQTHGLNPTDLIARFRHKRAAVASERNQLGGSLNQALTCSPMRLRIKNAINGCLNVSRIGDGLKVTATKPRDKNGFSLEESL